MKTKISYSKFWDLFNEANKEGKEIYGVIVFAKENWTTSYSKKSRSYATYSDQWGWDASKLGRCRRGFCLDGSEVIRLDYYDWKVQECYLISKEDFDELTQPYR